MFGLGRDTGYGYGQRRGSLILGLIVAAVVVFNYLSSSEHNAVTGEKQHLALSTSDEVALGLRAAPAMARQYGGLDPDPAAQARVDAVGEKLVRIPLLANEKWNFQFHLLGDRETVNAFALPGGQVFITRALYDRLKTEGQLAGVLGHEVMHVIGRHGAEQMAKQQLAQGLSGAAVIASGDQGTGQIAAMIGQMVNMKYGRGDELESDRWGLKFMSDAGYDPRAMVEVMKILKAAGGDGRQPEFFSTHPNPENRIQKLQAGIAELFPNGVPEGLTP